MYKEKFNLEREEKTVFIIRIVDRKFRASEKVTKTSVVSDENEVLLLTGQEIRVWFQVFPVCSKDDIPERHKETVVCSKVCMVAEVEFGRVEQVSQRRPLACPQGHVTDTNVHVTKGIDDVKDDKVGSNRNPVLASSDEVRQ